MGQSQLEHPFRFPVQWVNRPNAQFRGYSGTVVAGSIEVGQQVRVLPSGELVRVEETVLYKTNLERAIAEALIAYFITGEIEVALMIGGIAFILKFIIYYAHERLWSCRMYVRTSQ